jgi:Domain of unknown function (DUF4136)
LCASGLYYGIKVTQFISWEGFVFKRLFVVVLLILLAACATKRHVAFDVVGDYGAGGMRTYEIGTRAESVTDEYFIEAMVAAFDAKGYSRSAESPEFLVDYKLVQTITTRENPSPGNVPISGGSASGAYYGAAKYSANVWIATIDFKDPKTGNPFVESSVSVTTTKQNIDENLEWLIEPIMKDVPKSGERFGNK